MHPIILQLGPITLYSYGLLVALGVLTGMKVIDLEAIRYKWNRDLMSKLAIITFLMGLAGGRITYVITRLGKEDFFKVLLDPHAGFVFYGGLVGSWLFIYWQTRKRKMKIWQVLDAFALGICIGEGIGRFGCLLGGCCHGSACQLPWAVTLATEPGLGSLHPVPAYEGFLLIALFFILWKIRKKRSYDGASVVSFVGAYTVIRFIIEYFRGDLIRGYVIDNVLTTSQAIGLVMMIFVITLHFKLKKKSPGVRK